MEDSIGLNYRTKSTHTQLGFWFSGPDCDSIDSILQIHIFPLRPSHALGVHENSSVLELF